MVNVLYLVLKLLFNYLCRKEESIINPLRNLTEQMKVTQKWLPF